LLRGFVGEPCVWTEGSEIFLRADFEDLLQAARFAARTTGLTGAVCEFKTKKPVN
jgi:hypothetical protein